MDEREYRRRIRRNRIAQEEKKRIRQQLRQTMVVCALACVMLLVCCLWSAEPTYAKTNAATASGSCAALMRWPLNGAQVVGKYDAPKQQWLPGHRGVDLLADPQEAIVAPADGVIAFSGNVGGKAVVTIRHGGDLSGLTSTFEPAIAERDVGAHVAQGAFRACGGRIRPLRRAVPALGIKSEGRQYTNPESKTRTVRIGLKGL